MILRPLLAYKFAVSIGGIFLALAVGTSILAFTEAKRASLIELERQGDAIATTLNYSFEVLLDNQDVTSIQRIATNSILLPNVREVIAADLHGRVIASGDRIDARKPAKSPLLRAFLERGAVRAETHASDGDLILLRTLHEGKYTTALDSGIVGGVQITMDRRESEARAYAIAIRELGIHLGSYAILALVIGLTLHGLVVKPLYRIAEAARRIRKGDRGRRANIRSRDEIGLVGGVFDQMADEVEQTVRGLEDQVKARTADLEREVVARTDALDELRRTHEEVERAHADLSRAHGDLTRAHAELQASAEERLRLLDTVRELSTPVIRAHRHVVIAPIVGSVDDERARHIQMSLLEGIARHRARVALLDLTGAHFVTTDVVAALLRATRAAELLGARVVFVGMSPKVAMSLAGLDHDLSGIVALANLEQALARARHARGP